MTDILIQTSAFQVPEYELKPQANYKPRISAERLCLLWLLKRNTGKPITKLVAEAIDLYLKTINLSVKKGGEKNESTTNI